MLERSVITSGILVAAFFFGPIDATADHCQATGPNILWITSEDNAAHWLGCYGNPDARTPRLDELARRSILFERAYSNAPVCAVARCTILHGVYATSLGTQHMRSRYAIPHTFRPYVSYLRALGYYCTNRQKTDYNRAGNDRNIWDVCGNRAHYKHRAPNQPFFAVFNLGVTHESCLFPEKLQGNRRRGVIPQRSSLNPAHLQLPRHLPDLAEVRTDMAVYHDYLTTLDDQIGELLDELAGRGLAEDTIVFYYSDHGGPTPRGKRYLKDAGVRVPMLVHVPEKWRHLAAFQPGDRVTELVAFVDLAPTLLSLCGQEKPPQMQGRAFLGSRRIAPPEDAVVYLYADRFDEVEGMRRGITDGRYKYIRRFTPHLPAAPYSEYSLSMPSWIAWQQAWRENRLPAEYAQIWEAPQAVEELYDLAADPWEVQNLADEPAHATRLAGYRKRLRAEMLAVRDTSVIPESLFAELARGRTVYEQVRGEDFDYEGVLQFVMQATAAQPDDGQRIRSRLTDENAIIRYWAAVGCAILGTTSSGSLETLITLLDDPYAAVRIAAAEALARLGWSLQAQTALLSEFDRSLHDAALVQLINVVQRVGCENDVPRAWVERQLQAKDGSEYVHRFAEKLAGSESP